MNKYFFIVIAATLLVGCKEAKEQFEEPDIEALKQEVKPTEVTTVIAQFKPFEYLINSSGIIESQNELKISFQTNGYLEKLTIKNGSYIRKGDLIAQLSNQKEQLALERAQVTYDQTHVKFSSDSMAYGGNMTPLIQRNLELQSGLTNAEISLREAKLNLDNTFVYAPISGIVAGLEEKQGNMVNNSKELCVVYDPKNLLLKGKILETDFKHIKIGLKADIFPLAFKEMDFTSRIIEFNPKVDEAGMLEVVFKLSEIQGLLPGMNANAVIRVPQTNNIIIPREAVVIKSGKQVVFTMEDGLAKWKYVKVGLDNGVDLEILEGLEPGSEVITSNNIQLGHEARVSIATESLIK